MHFVLIVVYIKCGFVLVMISDGLLVRLNPWWGGKYSVEFKERVVYKKIKGFLQPPQVIALTGLRRTGKTTILNKIISDFLESGFEPRRILFYSFDDSQAVGLLELFEAFEKLSGLRFGEGKFLVVLDEVQKLSNWSEQVKRFYDLYYGKVKFVVTGSSSLFVKKKSRESLAGRLFEFHVEPLSFREFLDFKGIKFDSTPVFNQALEIEFVDYQRTQGFPELVGNTDREFIVKYLSEGIVDNVVYKDLPTAYKIRDVGLLKQLASIVIGQPGQLLDIQSLSRDLNSSRQTISSYLSYLEDSFLVIKLYNYSKNLIKRERKLKKYYSRVVSPRLVFDSN